MALAFLRVFRDLAVISIILLELEKLKVWTKS
jgi:hypothetical protein